MKTEYLVLIQDTRNIDLSTRSTANVATPYVTADTRGRWFYTLGDAIRELFAEGYVIEKEASMPPALIILRRTTNEI